ncbi:MAG: prepilin peptidase [Theionarchaea archaeon]|nr:prepilin peptidase [Theionarchaea archaeon]
MVPIIESVTLILLGYGSYEDIRSREISDYVWIVMGGCGLLARAWDHQWKIMGINLVIACGLSFILVVSGLFGGADIKALLSLSLLIPSYEGMVFPFFIITVFNNLAMLRIGEIVVVFIYNMVQRNRFLGEITAWKKIILYMTGFPMKTEHLDYRFLPLQNTAGNLRLIPDIDTDIDQFREEYSGDKVWVTYGSPLIAYMTIGCIIAFFYGDILLHIIMAFL